MTDAIKVQLESKDVHSLMSAAILAQMTGEQRDSLIADAIKQMIVPRDGGFGQNKTSPLQDAFYMAVNALSKELAKELIDEDPEIRQKIKDAMSEEIDKVLTGDVLTSGISEALSKAYRGY